MTEQDHSDPPAFTEDGRAAKAKEFLEGVLARMGMKCQVELVEPGPHDDEADICLAIEGDDAGRVIGKKGQTLAALQYIAHRVVNRSSLPRRHVTVDAEGYTERREENLASMAQRLAKQAAEDGKIITFEPMSPRDRRVVHLALKGLEGVRTESHGEGDSRRVQIIPVRGGRPDAQ